MKSEPYNSSLAIEQTNKQKIGPTFAGKKASKRKLVGF